jgi:hypothetical protein
MNQKIIRNMLENVSTFLLSVYMVCGMMWRGAEMEEKITIIEGPPPVFESVNEGWALGLNESPVLFETAITRLRTFNGPALVERCHRAWSRQEDIYLHYRTVLGLEARVPIVAARALEGDNGQVLYLWVRRELEESETDAELDDDQDQFSR